MTDDLLAPLPDDARAWAYALDRPLTASEADALLAALRPHLATWKTHGRPVLGDAAVVADRFVIVAGALEVGDISGCGIDASVHAVEAAAEAAGAALASPLLVYYRRPDGRVEAVGRAAFRARAAAGEVDGTTRVFDLGVATLGDVRTGRFERPAAESWHATAFRLSAPA